MVNDTVDDMVDHVWYGTVNNTVNDMVDNMVGRYGRQYS